MRELWSVKPETEVLVREIDEFLACYSFVTGKTHVLNAFPAEILRYLLPGARTAAELTAHLLACIGEDGDNRNVGIDQLLSELRDLQLLQVSRNEAP